MNDSQLKSKENEKNASDISCHEYFSSSESDLQLNLVTFDLLFLQGSSSESDIQVNLVTFDTENLDECLDFVVNNVLGTSRNGPVKSPVRGTGVGCMKFRDKITSTLNAQYVSNIMQRCHVKDLGEL